MKKNHPSIALIIFSLMLPFLSSTAGDFQLGRQNAKYDHAILQQQQPIVISGEHRRPGTRITVKFNGQEATTDVDKDKKFKVTFPAMSAGGPYSLEFSDGKETITHEDIYLGEVWLCVGQSNMMFPMTKMHSADTYAPAAEDEFPLIRTPGKVGWESATDIDTIKNWAGTPYYFARKLHQELKVPIGFLSIGQGGTSLWQWTPIELHETPELADFYKIMQARTAIAKEKGNKLPKENAYPPAQGFSEYRYPWFPVNFGGLAGYENWVPTYPARGIVFWQGENDIGFAANYELLFRGMLKRWRANADRDWPFFFIQLPSYSNHPGADSKLAGIEGLRDAQRRVAASEPNTYMTVSYDIYSPRAEIHPSNKVAFGERLAQTVLGGVYQKNVPWRSPEFVEAQTRGDAMILRFEQVGQELKLRGDEKTLTGFTLAGKDGVFHPAEASISTPNTVIAKSAQVPNPVAVRYAWDRNPVANLVGDGDLPVSPFRSDDWELYPLTP